MNDLTKTAAMVVIAAGLAGAVYVTRPVPVTAERFADVGSPLFPDFTDPTKAASLEVIAFDDATASYTPFKVNFDGKKWVIPSHHNYPADAKENMAQAAAAFIGVNKEVVASDRAADHEALGVLDPSDPAATTSGRGTRVTIKDAAGSSLVDVIVGKEAKGLAGITGTDGAAVGKRYVRLPAQQRTYIVSFNKTFSTKFSDWAQTDLLQMAGQQVAKIGVDRYSIDEQAGTKLTEERLLLQRDQAVGAGPPNFGWRLESSLGGGTSGNGGPGENEQINLTKINDVSAALREMRIAGVRPKPEKLVKLFGGSAEQVALDGLDQMNLQSRGFFVSPKGQLLANEGQASYVTNEGVAYNIYFGEVLFGEGAAISAGAEQPLGAPAGETPEEKKGQETRYVFIDATVDASVLPEPIAPTPPEPAPEGSDPAVAEAAKKAFDEAKAKYDADVAERSKKLEDANTKVDGLKKKFAEWYYVIDAKSFERLRPRRADLVQATPPTAAEGGGQPALTVPGQLPEGLPFPVQQTPPPEQPKQESGTASGG